MGIGDAFAHQGKAAAPAFNEGNSSAWTSRAAGTRATREHNIVTVSRTRARRGGRRRDEGAGVDVAYFSDADQIGVTTVDRFVAASGLLTTRRRRLNGQAGGGGNSDQGIRRATREVCAVMENTGSDGGARVDDRPDRVGFARKYLYAANKRRAGFTGT